MQISAIPQVQFLLQYHALDHIFAKNGKHRDFFAFLLNGGRGHGFRVALEISSSMATNGWVIHQICQHHIFQLRTLNQMGYNITVIAWLARDLWQRK